MLQIPEKKHQPIKKASVVLTAMLLLGGGLYVLSLYLSPAIADVFFIKPIVVSSLPAPHVSQNRIIIPKIGVNIEYGQGEAALNSGAQWRWPDRGNPEAGGNFIIAAHRLSIQPTPQGTIEKSPFYNIGNVAVHDKIIVDYGGVRYGYEVEKIVSVKPNDTSIEAESSTAKLTLYSCDLAGSSADRVVLVATPLGKVALSSKSE